MACDNNPDPRVNVRQIPSQLILKYKSDVEAKKQGWEEVNWNHLPLESGPGVGAASTVLKIRNPRPAWKSLVEGQLWNKYNSDVHIYGVDGYVPFHHILFKNVSKMLEEIILERVNSGSPPSSTKVLLIHLQDTKVCHIRVVLKVLTKGKVVIDPMEEEDIRQVLKMLGIDKVAVEKLPVDERTCLKVANREGDSESDVEDDGMEVDVEVVEEVKCGICALVFNSEIQLETHLNEECVQNFDEYCQLQNRLCFGCECRFKKYNAEEFIKHVDGCVKVNCQRLQEDEVEEVEKEQEDVESSLGIDSVEVCVLRECEVRCDQLTDAAVNTIQDLVRRKTNVKLQRMPSYQYVFEGDNAVPVATKARVNPKIIMNLPKSVEVRRRKPCPFSKRKLQKKIPSHPGQEVSPLPPLTDVTPIEVPLPPPLPDDSPMEMALPQPLPDDSPMEMALPQPLPDDSPMEMALPQPLPDVSPIEMALPQPLPDVSPIEMALPPKTTPSETSPATRVLPLTPAEEAITSTTITKKRKPGPKSRTMPAVISEPPPDGPQIEIAFTPPPATTPSETPPTPATAEQSVTTITKKRKPGPKSRTMPVVPPDIEEPSPPFSPIRMMSPHPLVLGILTPQRPVPVYEQVVAPVGANAKGVASENSNGPEIQEATSIPTLPVNGHHESVNEAERAVGVGEEAHAVLSEVEITPTSTSHNATPSYSSASLLRAAPEIPQVSANSVPPIVVVTECNDTNPLPTVTQTFSADAGLSTPTHSILSALNLRPRVSPGPGSVTSGPSVTGTPIQRPPIPSTRLTISPSVRGASPSIIGTLSGRSLSNGFRQQPPQFNNPTFMAANRMQQQRVVSPVVSATSFAVPSSRPAQTQGQLTLSQRQQIEYQSYINPNQTRLQQAINSAMVRYVAPTPPPPLPRFFNLQSPGRPRNNSPTTQNPETRQVPRRGRPPKTPNNIQRPRQQRVPTPTSNTLPPPTGNPKNPWDYISTIPMNNFYNQQQVSTSRPTPHCASTSASNLDPLFDAPEATLVPPVTSSSADYSLNWMSNERRTSQPSERVHITCPECNLSFGSPESLNDHYENGGCN